MKTAAACAVLAVAAWVTYALYPGHEEALVFAIVWTAMAAAYGARLRLGRSRQAKSSAGIRG